MIDLRTTFMGLQLRNPLVASSSPISDKLDGVKQLEAAGVSAVILPSLFEEQLTIESEHLEKTLEHGAESFAEAISYFPGFPPDKVGPDRYLHHIEAVKKAVHIPVIASLNGVSLSGWLQFARQIEDAGADGLELNVYHIPTDPALGGGEVEQRYVHLVRTLKEMIRIPIAVKLGPFFSAPANMVKRLADAKADAIVLFNRFYQPDFDIDNAEVVTNLQLSTPEELRLRLRWVAIMYGRVPVDFGITGGVHSAQDVIKSVMSGARVAMMTSALLQRGIPHATKVLADMQAWMEEHEYPSVQVMRGCMSQRAVADPGAFERANYLKVLSSYALAAAGEQAS